MNPKIQCQEFRSTGQGITLRSESGFPLSGPCPNIKALKLAWKLKQHPYSEKYAVYARIRHRDLHIAELGTWYTYTPDGTLSKADMLGIRDAEIWMQPALPATKTEPAEGSKS